MRMRVFALSVAILTCLACMGLGNSQAVDTKPRDELHGFEHSRHKVNKNIHHSFRSYYMYLAYSYCFSRHNVSLPGFERLFRSYSDMELQNAEKLMGYMVKRGMTFTFHSIHIGNNSCYDRDDDGESARTYVLRVITDTLKNQKMLLSNYIKTQETASLRNYPHLKHFIEDEFMEQKYLKIKEMADIKTRLRTLLLKKQSGFELFMFDKSLM
ncbi:ferritin-like [Pecten maximus]|uniref:ferritin-like n=1 Tax=Pecten maximus TaxID=6579 RepID=UPI0014582EC0|nr:ferritin-like [Pecten maximus]